MKKKGLALLLALTLVVVGVASGTLAWLTAKTDTVTNTFTTSDITVTLAETTGEEYQMIPGYTIEKDPTVTVVAGSEKCYLFVKLEKSAGFDEFMTYQMADGWTELTDNSGIYYRVVEKAVSDTVFPVLKDNTVSVKGEVTKEMMKGLTTNPTLKVTAYAAQYNSSNNATFTPAEAWAKVAPTNP